MKIKIRLIIMNVLQYAIWGAWLISLGGYLGGKLNYTGVQIGSFFATMGIASLVMPAIMGIIADRWVNAEKVLAISHLISGTFMFVAAGQTEYHMLYTFILLAVLFYMPTIALSNSAAYNALAKHNMDPIKHFPPVRIFGTIGFIVSMILVDLIIIDGVALSKSANQLYFSAIISFALGLYSFTLPRCDINKNPDKSSLVDMLGLRAFTLFKEKRMAVFFVFSMLLGVALQITNAFANLYLTDYFGNMPQYANSFGVRHANILISISQMSETLCILLIPFFLRRYGIKNVMLMSMIAWVLRFALLGTGNPGDGVWMLILSMIIYGFAFDFFNISGSLYVETETSPSIRSSAQGVFMIMTNGFGALIGSYAAGKVVDVVGWPNSWFVFAAYALVVFFLFWILFDYKHEPEKISKSL
ncbi:MAG: nucleoside permease [Lentimicrobiaceae bacterium]|nr:nucleoside permease [Lentimicrobiaceae bacterium]